MLKFVKKQCLIYVFETVSGTYIFDYLYIHKFSKQLYMEKISDSHYIPREAYGDCFSYESRFNYTIFFLILTPFFWLFEFLTLRDDHEPTGLRKKLKVIINIQNIF